MKFISEYRDPAKAKALARQIADVAGDRPMTFMEVCGTHTMALARFGIRQLLPESIRMISGPGCPVCVTSNRYLDHAIALARLDDVTVLTFGDMMRVPGSTSSLEKERAAGRDIRIVYSTLDALDFSRKNPERETVFLGIGFETTAPTIAASITMARAKGITNYSVLCAHKVVPPALEALLARPPRPRVGSRGGRASPVELDGFLLPGHVSTIIGAGAYRPILEGSNAVGVIAGFEPTDILEAILELARQVTEKRPRLHTSYVRAVTELGNTKAKALLEEVFETCDAKWRGVGTIPASGLTIRPEFSAFDAARKFRVEVEPTVEPKGCRCGEILTGLIQPTKCPLFGGTCTPAHPVGACMVSSEGTCAAFYKYREV